MAMAASMAVAVAVMVGVATRNPHIELTKVRLRSTVRICECKMEHA